MILSSRLKIRKLSPEPFREAPRRINVPVDRCAYIGNRLSRDVVGCELARFALGLIIEPSCGPRADEQGQTFAPDVVIHSLNELLEIFSARV